jgi:hypothetical protein
VVLLRKSIPQKTNLQPAAELNVKLHEYRMNILHFRILVVLVMFLSVFGGTIDFFIANETAENVSTYADSLKPELKGNHLLILIVILVPGIICMIGSFIGLLLLKSWGRTLFLLGFLVTLPLGLYLGVTVVSPLAQLFYDLGVYGEGFILALCYFSPLSIHFKKQI